MKDVRVLFDATSAANAALDTGTIDTHSFNPLGAPEAVLFEEAPSAAAAAGTLSLFDLDFSASIPVQTTATPATTAATLGEVRPVPRKIRMTLTALGVGVTSHLRLLGVWDTK
jgi:hypothetical protein